MQDLKFDIHGVRTILLQLFDSKPPYPITSKKTLIAALGGKDHQIKINRDIENVPVTTLADKAFKKQQEFQEPNEILDALIGGSFVNVIAKTNIMQIINNLNYPIEDDSKLEKSLASIKIYGLSPAEISNNITFPIKAPTDIINQLSVTEKQLFEVDLRLLDGLTELETFIPAPMKKVPKKEKKLEYYRCYLIEESKPKYCFEVLEEALTKGSKGLCITRTHPKQLQNQYELIAKKAEVLWLTDRESVKEYPTVSPRIGNVSLAIEDFIDNNSKAVLLLDGLEYLIDVNSYKPVLFFVQGIKDKIAENEALLLFSVSPQTFDNQQLKAIERETEIVMDGEKLRFGLEPAEAVPEKVEAPKKLIAEAASKIFKEPAAEPAAPSEDEDVEEPVEEEPMAETPPDLKSDEGMMDEELEIGLAEKISKIDEMEPEPSPPSSPDLQAEITSELEETAQELGVVTTPTGDREPCRSCDGTGKCIWCDVTGKCETCKGTGKDSEGNPCADCKGSGQCRSCEGSGKCRWCKGEG
ncbi:MAG: DUF835 domain-containing protein [Thermoplasmata archaeon]|nr:DUF835 domain-containing protein [Thermoplasmata archaeon]